MPRTPKLFIVAGTPGSGKDLLIRAVNDLGTQHASIVPKHTTRPRRSDDGVEMICPSDHGFDLAGSDLIYNNFGTDYGIHYRVIWEGLRAGVFQVAVVSNINAINRLKEAFGALVVLVFVHSEISAEQYRKSEKQTDVDYVAARAKDYEVPFRFYLKNLLAFDHVLISSGTPEDLYDQIFRLFRAYEQGLI